MAVKAGLTLESLINVQDMLDPWALGNNSLNVGMMVVLALLSILPTYPPVQRQVDRLLNRAGPKKED